MKNNARNKPIEKQRAWVAADEETRVGLTHQEMMSRWESCRRDNETAVGVATKGARGSSGVLLSKGR